MRDRSLVASSDRDQMHGRHSHAKAPPWLLKLGIALTFTTFVLGMIFWQFSGSVAVLADALHGLFHTILFSIALWGNVHGDMRRQARASLVMGVIIIAVAVYIGASGVISILSPAQVVSWHMIIIACIALASEITQGILMLSVEYNETRVRKIYLIKVLLRDVWIDALASLGVLAGGVVIMFTQFYRTDGIAAIPIALAALALGIITILEGRDELRMNEHDAHHDHHAHHTS